MDDKTRYPTRIAVLTMDIEPAATASLADPTDVLDAAARTVALAREMHITVASVRMAFDDRELLSVPRTSHLAAAVAASGRALHKDSPSTAVHAQVAPLDGDIVIRKTRVGAFYGSDLDERLRQRGVNTVVLTGVQTSGVVLSAVREAADRDYRIFVVAQACADPNPELHELLMTRIFPRQASIVSLDELELTLVAAATGD